MESAGGNNTLLGLHNPVGRKEWRVVTEGSARDRLPVDGSMDHSRVNGSARIRPLHSENSRNGRILHSGASSGSSSDSDHLPSDVNHGTVSSHESIHQNVEDIKLYDEEPTSNGHPSSASNGIPLDFGILSSSKHETLEQRLHDIIRQREHLQRVEAELRAQFIARSEILRVKNNFDEQAKQHASIVTNLQEQLQDQNHRVCELEQKLEERERQLHVNQKEVWAKDGLLREQTSELASLRRERETLLADQKSTVTQFESDRAQFVSRLQDLEDQLQEKDRQLQEMDEQHRTSQETLAYKDEQLREAQAWVQRAQELDAFYANSHNSLHAELRDCNEQLNQLWLGQQRQLAEVERFHSQTIQRLRMEVAEVREQNRVLKCGSTGNIDSKNGQSLRCNGLENDHSSAIDSSLNLRKGAAPGNNQAEHAGVLPVPAAPVIGATTPFLTGSPIPVLHQVAGQPESILPTIAAAPNQIIQSKFSNPVVIPAQQQLPLINQQALHCKLIQQPQPSQRFVHPPPLSVYSHFPDTKSPISIYTRGNYHQHQQIEQRSCDQVVIDQGGISTGRDFSHINSDPVPQHSANMQLAVQTGQVTCQESSPCAEKQAIQDKHVNEERPLDGLEKGIVLQDTKERPLQRQPEKNDHLLEDKDAVKDGNLLQVFPQHSHSNMHHLELRNNTVVTDDMEHHHAIDSNKIEGQQMTTCQGAAVNSIDSQEAQVNRGQAVPNKATVPASVVPQTSTAEGNGKSGVPVLLDEKSLLACLVRAIPSESSARIKISTTLPNRLGKMLAPLHWHDYKKQYGRLNDFISSHPKLFVVDGDFVHLREGAHAIISATTAVAKVAAAVAAPSTFGTNWPPTVAITPVAQSQIQRMRKNTAPMFLGAKEVPVQGGTQNKEVTLFSHGMVRLHQGYASKDLLVEKQAPQYSQRSMHFNGINGLNGSKLMSALGSRSDGTASKSTNASVVDLSSASQGTSNSSWKNEMSFVGRQGPRCNAVESEPFVGKEISGLSPPQESRHPRAS